MAESDKYIIIVQLNGKPQKFEVDSGAKYSLLSELEFQQLNLNIPLQASNIPFRSYSGNIIQPKGKIVVTVARDSGRITHRASGIRSVARTEGVKPVFTKGRSIPYALKHRVDKELDALIADGIISPVPTTDWGSSLVVIPKQDGGVRLCVDYKCRVNERKDKRWLWTPNCEEAFLKIKAEHCGNRVLIPFDPALPPVLITDASPTGIASVLSHTIEGGQKTEATIFPVVDNGPVIKPLFITKPGNFSAVRGDTVRLPCHAVNIGKYIQAWKRDIAVLTAGKVKLTPDSRIQLVGDDYDLEIVRVNINDSGTYVCQVGAYKPVEITHSFLVKVPPVIERITSGGLVEVKKGTTIVLECKTSGIPPPTITWTRKNNLVVAGVKSITGSSLTINQTTRHHAGVYMCTADNGVLVPVTKEINVNILFSPEIEVERVLVHAGIGTETQLVCIVHAYPPASVRWFTDSMRLENTEKIRMENRGSRHSLIIRDVEEKDFTNYSCEADNSQGKLVE
ncbi:opioid-binding protein/cell adhesion molecule homolog [Halyomorpha halys]|uniref:opioid-binding protein/cell adhesion molecule homolog n=1 Tax=Halyomorpha halys TaxID=286706 RepID=UPI0034D1BEAC